MSRYPFIFERKNTEFLAIDSETVVALDDISWVTTFFKHVQYFGHRIPLYRVQIELKNGNSLGWVPTGFEGVDYWVDRRNLVRKMATKINELLQSSPPNTTTSGNETTDN